MSSEEIVSASCSAEDVCVVFLPGWPQEPRVEARTDGKNEITLELPRIHPAEAWRLVAMRRGWVCPVVYLRPGAPKPQGRIRRTNYDAVLYMPPERLKEIRVLTHRGTRPRGRCHK